MSGFDIRAMYVLNWLWDAANFYLFLKESKYWKKIWHVLSVKLSEYYIFLRIYLLHQLPPWSLICIVYFTLLIYIFLGNTSFHLLFQICWNIAASMTVSFFFNLKWYYYFFPFVPESLAKINTIYLSFCRAFQFYWSDLCLFCSYLVKFCF